MLVSKMAALKMNAILRAFGMNIVYWGAGECRRDQCELATYDAAEIIDNGG